MRRNGFTLIEIMIVIAVMGILMAFATLEFAKYVAKGAIERQAKEMYTDLMAARTAAVTQHVSTQVVITPTSITSNSTTRPLSKQVTWAGKAPSDTQKVIIFDERGTFDIVNNGNTTICVEPSIPDAQVDSVVVFSTRIHLGKVYFVGLQGDCKSDNVTVQ